MNKNKIHSSKIIIINISPNRIALLSQNKKKEKKNQQKTNKKKEKKRKKKKRKKKNKHKKVTMLKIATTFQST